MRPLGDGENNLGLKEKELNMARRDEIVNGGI